MKPRPRTPGLTDARLQAIIEALERAVNDENTLAPGRYQAMVDAESWARREQLRRQTERQKKTKR